MRAYISKPSTTSIQKMVLAKLLIVLLLSSLFVPLTVRAVVEIENPLKADTFTELVTNIIRFLRNLAILGIGPIMIIMAGFYFITAAGDPEKIKTAKKMLLWTLVGILIILCAEALITFIKEIIGVKEAILPNSVVPFS